MDAFIRAEQDEDIYIAEASSCYESDFAFHMAEDGDRCNSDPDLLMIVVCERLEENAEIHIADATLA